MGSRNWGYFSALPAGVCNNPVVWYNDAENPGMRVLTVPVGDFVYAPEKFKQVFSAPLLSVQMNLHQTVPDRSVSNVE
jgi:hypothetical protein